MLWTLREAMLTALLTGNTVFMIKVDLFTHSTLQFGTRPVFGVVGRGAVETVACRSTHSAVWRAGITCSLRGMGIALWTAFTTLSFKEVPLHSKPIFATASTFVRCRIGTFEACVVAKMTLSVPFILPKITMDHAYPIIKKPGVRAADAVFTLGSSALRAG